MCRRSPVNLIVIPIVVCLKASLIYSSLMYWLTVLVYLRMHYNNVNTYHDTMLADIAHPTMTI